MTAPAAPTAIMAHIKSFGFTFTGEQPITLLYGPTWGYLSENLNNIIHLVQPVVPREDRVHIVEISGMEITDWQRDINMRGRRLATFAETVQVLHEHPELQEVKDVPVFVLGEGWIVKPNGVTHDLYTFFDCTSGSGDSVRSMHSEFFGPNYVQHELFAAMRVRVIIVGDWLGK
jgi:hypothetical protein